MEFFNNSVFFGVLLSLLAYGIGALLKQKFKLAIFNPLLIAVIIVIAVLAVSELIIRYIMKERNTFLICLHQLQSALLFRFMNSSNY